MPQPQVKTLAIAGYGQTGRLHGRHGVEVRGAQRTFRKPCRQQARLEAVRSFMPGEDDGSRLKEQLCLVSRLPACGFVSSW
jgi:hypothetical protein